MKVKKIFTLYSLSCVAITALLSIFLYTFTQQELPKMVGKTVEKISDKPIQTSNKILEESKQEFLKPKQNNHNPNTPQTINIDQKKKEKQSIEFIESYYNYIEAKDFERAYALSKKSVSIETFRSWYKNVHTVFTSFVIPKQGVTDTYVTNVTSFDDKEVSTYEVHITLQYDKNNNPIQIASSEVNILDKQDLVKHSCEKNHAVLASKRGQNFGLSTAYAIVFFHGSKKIDHFDGSLISYSKPECINQKLIIGYKSGHHGELTIGQLIFDKQGLIVKACYSHSGGPPYTEFKNASKEYCHNLDIKNVAFE